MKRQRRAPDRQRKQQRWVPPYSSHDIHSEHYAALRPWIEDDVATLREAESTGPFVNAFEAPSRFPDMIERVTRCGLGDRGPRLMSKRPGTNMADISAIESSYLLKNPFLERVYFDILNLNLHGNRVYHYTDPLIQRMLNTRINVANESVHLPFNALAMTTRSETLLRVFLCPKRQKTYDPGMGMAITATIKRDEGLTTLLLTTYLIKSRRPLEMTNAHMSMRHGETVADAIAQFCGTQDARAPLADADTAETLLDWFKENATAYYRTVINCLLYLATPRTVISDPYEPVPSKLSANSTRSTALVQDVGRGIEPLYINPSDIFRTIRKGIEGNGTKLAWRVLVSGHWRAFPHQAVLGEMAQRNWIEPFWRGADDSPERNKPYVVS